MMNYPTHNKNTNFLNMAKGSFFTQMKNTHINVPPCMVHVMKYSFWCHVPIDAKKLANSLTKKLGIKKEIWVRYFCLERWPPCKNYTYGNIWYWGLFCHTINIRPLPVSKQNISLIIRKKQSHFWVDCLPPGFPSWRKLRAIYLKL